MDAFIRYVVENLTDAGDDLELTRSETARKITFRLRLPQQELGKIIGKQGRTIQAIRNLVAAGAARQGQRAILQIEE